MNAIGIICEYNPFHLGHARMLEGLRRQYDAPLVCAMSGNFVQRGDAAVAHKHARAEMAVRCGADLVLCGHTHRGQLFPVTLFTKWAYGAERFWGHHQLGKTHVMVSAGCGVFQLPVRVGTDNEVVSIDLLY